MDRAQARVIQIFYLIFYAFFAYGSRVVLQGGDQQHPDTAIENPPCISISVGSNPPDAEKRPSILKTAAGDVQDDFWWLRDDNRNNEEVLANLRAENAYSKSVLRQLQPLPAQLASEMEQHVFNTTETVPVRYGSWWYHEAQLDGRGKLVMFRRPAVQLTQTASSDGASDATSISTSSTSTSSRSQTAAPSVVWDESGPDSTAGMDIVLDPNLECELVLEQRAEGSPSEEQHIDHRHRQPDSKQHAEEITAAATAEGEEPQEEAAAEAAAAADGPSCDVYGAEVSPDSTHVAYGMDIGGSEQYQLRVRNVVTGRSVLDAPIPETSGDYEWAADSNGLFYITRNSTTKRPDSVWYISILQPATPPVLLWRELNPAFYLSLSRSSSGRFLLLSIASEVTQQVLLLDLTATQQQPQQQQPQQQPPSSQQWLHLAPRRPHVQYLAVGHWQDWLLMVVVSPTAPNGELRVAAVDQPQHHMVLLPHRSEVQLEDMRVFAGHLVLAERQLGHTTITVHCLPANNSKEAMEACRYNSSAAAAAQAHIDAAATPVMAGAAEAAAAEAPANHLATSSSGSSSHPHSSSNNDPHASSDAVSTPVAELPAPIPAESSSGIDERVPDVTSGAKQDISQPQITVVARESSSSYQFGDSSSAAAKSGDSGADTNNQEQLMSIDKALALLKASSNSKDADQQGHFMLIRGRAGSSPSADGSDDPDGDGLGPAQGPDHIDYAATDAQPEPTAPSPSGSSTSLPGTVDTTTAAAADSDAIITSSSSRPGNNHMRYIGNAGSSSSMDASRRSTQQTSALGSSSSSLAANDQPGMISSSSTANTPSTNSTISTNSGSSSTSGSRAGSGFDSLSALLPSLLLVDNSWQVTFEEDSYSVSLIDNGAWDNPLLRLSYTSFTTPQSIIDIHMHTQRRVVQSVARVGSGFKPEDYRSYRLWATAADGVSVPVSLCYRLDAFARNGLNPALLLVYGAYGVKYDPEFDARLLSLLDRGWVVGIAHVRGGGELGHNWHNAGRLMEKPTSFGDLIAAAEALVAANITSHSRLAVWARSAGALTAAGAINKQPGLFNAALLDVPFLDVLGDLLDGQLPLTVKEWEEWGSPLHNASQAALITSFSPTLNINAAAVADYPHMLLTAGLLDTRVGYWEAAKYVAQLRAAAAEAENGDSSGSSSSSGWLWAGQQPQQQQSRQPPVFLLRTDLQGGHYTAGGSGSSLDEAALKYAFLISTLPSCGGSDGLTGLPAPGGPATGSSQGRWLAAAGVSEAAGQRLQDMLQQLPSPLHGVLVCVLSVTVVSGLLAVAWQASRLWWPVVIRHTDLLELNLDSLGPATGGAAAPRRQQARSRLVGRRVSTAAGCFKVTAVPSVPERQSFIIGSSSGGVAAAGITFS